MRGFCTHGIEQCYGMNTTQNREPSRLTEENGANRIALTVDEFARAFGRHRSWAYRQLYSGTIRKIDIPGRILIPVGEADRLASTLAIHGEAN